MKVNAIAFFLTFLVFTSSPYKDNATVDIVEVFKTGKIEFNQAYVSGWAKLQEPGGSRGLESIVDLVSKNMGVDFIESEMLVDYGLAEKRLYKGSYESGSILLKIEDKYNSSLKNNERVIIIDITQYGKSWNISNIRERLTKCLKELGSGPPASICIEGYIDGEVPNNEREKLINSILTSLGAVSIESINTDNLMSVSGYTANIKEHIKSNDKKININIASRYSPSDKKTYFWIGTPVLNIEY